ncbi:MAG TPA: DJ-1/PfpI family protein [Thermoanaerobaculia bacterium]|nr:DJ-1/PfpI family protein [Thermoanaerobaculia bacterium]
MKTLMLLFTAILLAFPALSASNLKAPAKGKIKVAFVLTEGATMIDFAGPWEVFQDVHVPSRGTSMDDQMPFSLYTVSQAREPIRTSGGMKVVPDYTFADAPMPDVVVVGAQRGSKDLAAWLRKVAPEVDVLMSVCTGAFKLADAGLLDGKRATTHHDFFDRFEKSHPKVELVRGRRFVEANEVIASAGGLTSGIDLALHVVSRYFGEAVAAKTAEYMEYESDGWKRGDVVIAKRVASE